MNIRYIVSLMVFTFLIGFISCREDDPGRNMIPAKSTFVLSAKSDSQPIDPGMLSPEADSDNELINTWWIVFARKTDRSIYTILNRPTHLTAPVEEESIDADLPADTYIIYAFANVTPDELKEKTGLNFEIGSQLPDGDIESVMWNTMENNPDKSKYIPMSGMREITVTGRVTEPFAIEVVRMLAKVEFCFMNESGSDITVKSVDFGPLNTGSIPLMPTYAPSSAPIIAESCGIENLNYSFGSGSEGIKVVDKIQLPVREKFYVRESVADSHPSKHFNFSLKIERGGSEEEILYAVTDELQYINRNDYIQIPVLFAELKLDMEVRFYPPIGGYPAVKVEPAGNEVYNVTFGTSGGFEILPKFTEVDGSEIVKDKVVMKVLAISDPDGIFERLPVAESSGELTGVLSSEEGMAEVSLSMEVTTVAGVKRVYNRKVYIIRKNNP